MQIPEQQHRKSRLLLIEDDPIVRAFIFKVLGPEGYEVVQADGALNARNILSFDTKFDCILLDLGLEDGEGLDLMSELRERPELRHVPFVLESGRSKASDIRTGLAAGAYYYLRKPLDETLLSASVQAASEWGRLARDNVASDNRAFDLLKSGSFILRTFDEARDLARCLGGAGSTRKTVQLVVQELLFNAIEHGNLGIDYNAKGALLIAGGLEDEIARRLADPDLGSRHVEVTYQLDGQRLSVTITDQGDGFAWDEYLHISDERIFHPHGRGLPMTHSLADELVFTGRGNIVTATWHQPR